VPRRILISPGDASYNLGDEAILASTILLLREFVDDCQISVYANRPERIERLFGVRAIPKGKGILRALVALPKAIAETKRSDLLLWGGGQLVQDISSRLYVPFHISRLALAILLGTPTFVYCIGAGPIKSFSSRLLTRIFLSRARAITVRDASSAEALSGCGIDRARISVAPDPALVLTPDEGFDVRRFLLGIGLDLQRPILAVAPRRLFHRNFGLLPIRYRVRLGLISPRQRVLFERFKSELAKFLDYVAARYDLQILFIPMYRESGQDDQGIGRQIGSLVSMKDNLFYLPVGCTARQLLAIMARMYAVVAVRMHAAVLSAVANVPLISIHYAPKGERFMSNIGLSQYTLAAEQIAADVLIRRFNQLIENYSQIRSVLRQNVKSCRRDILSNISRIREVLGLSPLGEEAVARLESLLDTGDAKMQKSSDQRRQSVAS